MVIRLDIDHIYYLCENSVTLRACKAVSDKYEN